MGAVIEVDWFNTYLLKKVTDNDLQVELNTGQDFNTPRDGFALSPGVAYPGQTTVLSLSKFLGKLTDFITSQGSGYTNGEYNTLTVTTSGNGTGALFSVVVNNNAVASVTATASGRGYAVGDTVTLSGIPGGDPIVLTFSQSYGIFQDFSWYVEESRIRGGYNNPATDKGVKAFINEPEPQQQHRFNTLIYSGVYNSRTGINETNVFSVSDDLTRSADPQNGSIQKTYAEDTNLIVFQEDKISRALIDKDTIYTTEGGTQTQAGAKVLGQIVPYKGEYGISNNPESFAVYGYRKYFADRDRSAIMRLSNDGLTEVSAYGMTDYFRDELALILNNTADYVVNGTSSAVVAIESPIITLLTSSILADGYELSNLTPGMLCSFITVVGGDNTNNIVPGYVTQVVVSGNNTLVYMSSNISSTQIVSGTLFRFTSPIKPRIVGGWDIHNKNYVISLQKTPTQVDNFKSSSYKTLTFDESINGWVSFTTYKPEMMGSLKNNFYTFTESDLYEHYDETTTNNRGIYYGVYSPSTVTFVFNPSPSTVKVFKTVEYEGSNGWEVESYVSGFTEPNLGPSGTYLNTQDTTSSIYSYDEGLYTDSVTGQPQRAGFYRKEDRYVANLVSSSVAAPGEIRFGTDITGIKGYFATVKVKTDVTTQQGGTKELWAVGTEYVPSTGY
jgi:hypothetical protein